MARCLLCTSTVDDAAPVCPHCGGAVVADEAVAPWDDDPTRVDGPPTHDAPAYGSAPPEAAPTFDGPPSYGGPTYGAPPGYGPPAGYGSPPGYGPPPAFGPPPAYGAPAYGPPAYGVPAYGGPPYGAPGAYGYSPYGGAWVRPLGTDTMAVAALITVVVGIVTGAFCGLTALACPVGAILGHVSLSRIARTGEQGRGLALAAIIIGWGITALGVLGLVLLIGIGVSG